MTEDDRCEFRTLLLSHWFQLPFALRQRWWRETEYGRRPPSDELKKIIEETLGKKNENDLVRHLPSSMDPRDSSRG